MRRRDIIKGIGALPFFGLLGCTPTSAPEQEEPCCPTGCGENEIQIPELLPDDPVGCTITPKLKLINIVVEFEKPSIDILLAFDPLKNRYTTRPQEVRIIATFKEEYINMEMVWYGFNCWAIDITRVRRCIMEMPWGSNVSNFDEFVINLDSQTFRLASIECYGDDDACLEEMC